MQINTFTNSELAVCLDVLYGPKGKVFDGFSCKDVDRYQHFKEGIEIKGPSEEIEKVIAKVKSINLRLWTGKEQSLAEIDYFVPSKVSLILTNAKAVALFKDAIYQDLQADEKSHSRYLMKTGPKSYL